MRIIYWSLSCLEPEIEAISKEIFQLARHFHNSLIFGINPHYVFRSSWSKRYIGFHPAFDPFLRILIPLVEQYADINHVYGELCPWTFYKTLKKKPLLLTIASEKGQLQLEFLARCRKVIVQTETLQRKLLMLGVEKEKVELLYSGVDISHYRPFKNEPAIIGTPKVLFASAPRSKEELEERGVNLLLSAAKESPDIHYRFLFRQWRSGYTSLEPTRHFIDTHRLQNVSLTNSIVRDMPRVYNDYHFLVIPYTRPDGGKECPNSLVEALACGLPILITSVSPFAYFVTDHRCGIVFEPTSSGLIAAVETGARQYRALSKNAINAARTHLSQSTVLKRLENIYQEVQYER